MSSSSERGGHNARSSLEGPGLFTRNSSLPLQPGAEARACPRCGSENTKFCYFNNYDPQQPRHWCKGCKRHWTVGGVLRNIPPGSGRRKSRSGGPSMTGKRSALNHLADVAAIEAEKMASSQSSDQVPGRPRKHSSPLNHDPATSQPTSDPAGFALDAIPESIAPPQQANAANLNGLPGTAAPCSQAPGNHAPDLENLMAGYLQANTLADRNGGGHQATQGADGLAQAVLAAAQFQSTQSSLAQMHTVDPRTNFAPGQLNQHFSVPTQGNLMLQLALLSNGTIGLVAPTQTAAYLEPTFGPHCPANTSPLQMAQLCWMLQHAPPPSERPEMVSTEQRASVPSSQLFQGILHQLQAQQHAQGASGPWRPRPDTHHGSVDSVLSALPQHLAQTVHPQFGGSRGTPAVPEPASSTQQGLFVEHLHALLTMKQAEEAASPAPATTGPCHVQRQVCGQQSAPRPLSEGPSGQLQQVARDGGPLPHATACMDSAGTASQLLSRQLLGGHVVSSTGLWKPDPAAPSELSSATGPSSASMAARYSLEHMR